MRAWGKIIALKLSNCRLASFVSEQHFVEVRNCIEMATQVRLEDRIYGIGNFDPWKARIVLILEEN